MSCWWNSDQWREYERICDVQVSRMDELRSATWQTQVIDLSLSEKELWRDIRRSNKPLIHRSERQWTLEERLDVKEMESFRHLHAQVSGRATRPIESWALMAAWLDRGHLRLFGAYPDPFGDAPAVAFAAFYVWDQYAYYGHSARIVDDVECALIWRAMRWLKASGTRWLEMGWQAREGDSAKDRGIAEFKRGFGGTLKTANFCLTLESDPSVGMAPAGAAVRSSSSPLQP